MNLIIQRRPISYHQTVKWPTIEESTTDVTSLAVLDVTSLRSKRDVTSLGTRKVTSQGLKQVTSI